MDDNDFDNSDYFDAVRYLMHGLQDDLEFDPEEEQPPMVGLSKMLEQDFTSKTVYYGWDPSDPTHYANIGYSKADCSHQWKAYYGFTEKYEFCEKCPAKKDIL